MENIPLDQLQKLFIDLRSETDWDIDGEMLWGFYFLSPDADKLMAAGGALAEQGYTIVGIFEEEAEDEEGNPVETLLNVLHVERVENHTPETLFARNTELEAFAAEYGLDSYDGMDVNPVGEEDEEDEGEGETLDNPDLLAAIEALQEGDSELAQASQDALIAELQLAVYLIPVFGAPEEETSSVQVLICTDEEGAEFVPLFTDVASLKAWTDEPVSAMAVHADEAWDFVLAQADCQGAVINPAGESLALPREHVETLKAVSDANDEE